MSLTEKLLRPLLAAAAQPLITYYDDALGARVELSRATTANWAAKTANWLLYEWDVQVGTPIAVRLPAHWQTLGVLLGAWWCGATITDDPDGAEVAFVAPDHAPADTAGAATVAIVSLDPLGRGLTDEPADGAVDYLNEIRVQGDDFDPPSVPGDTLAFPDATVDDVVTEARARAKELGIGPGDRVLSTRDWSIPDGVRSVLLPVLAAQASLVQCVNSDPAALAARRSTERITIDLT
ncbi:MAG TPA: TIGR03089 family protein [Pseudonocardiaceae bacterium]